MNLQIVKTSRGYFGYNPDNTLMYEITDWKIIHRFHVLLFCTYRSADLFVIDDAFTDDDEPARGIADFEGMTAHPYRDNKYGKYKRRVVYNITEVE